MFEAGDLRDMWGFHGLGQVEKHHVLTLLQWPPDAHSYQASEANRLRTGRNTHRAYDIAAEEPLPPKKQSQLGSP